MVRTTQDVVEMRRWSEARGGRPCRDQASGHLHIALPGETCERGEVEVGWDEFEATFCFLGCVFLYDDAPGARRLFVGAPEAARAWLTGAAEHDARL